MQQQKDSDLGEYPSLDQEVQLAITAKYMKLNDEIEAQGLYNSPYLEYGKEMVRYTILFASSMYALHSGWYITSAFCLSLFWVSSDPSHNSHDMDTLANNSVLSQQQIMFVAHDAGHRAITGIFEVDTVIGMFVADFCCGLSIGWWKSSHNVHHLITNMPVRQSHPKVP